MPSSAAQVVQRRVAPLDVILLALSVPQQVGDCASAEQLTLKERASQAQTNPACQCRASLRAHVIRYTKQRAVAVQAQPITQELPSWAQTNFSLPMASEAARSRHALLPTMSSTRRVTPASTALMGPLYPSFDSSPVAPIDYGPAHAAQQQAQQQALPPPPSAPPMPQHVSSPCSSPALGNFGCPPAWTSCATALAPCD